MTDPSTIAAHLSDGTLVSLIDDEGEQAPVVRQHLASCVDCAARLSRMTLASDSAKRSLGDIVLPAFSFTPANPLRMRTMVGPRRTMAYRGAIAATLLLIASAAAATPVRAWLSRHFTGADDPAAPRPQVGPPLAPTPAGMIVSFTPTDSILTVRVANRQAAGSINLGPSPSSQVSAQITAGGAAEELLIAPGEVRIRNSATSGATYRIATPAMVRMVRVYVGEKDQVGTVVRTSESFTRMISVARQ